MVRKKISGRYANIANRLRVVRAYFEMGSKEFADQAGVPPKSYSQWESGDFRVSIDGAIRLRDRYGISMDFIYTGSLDTLPNKIAAAVSSNPLLKNSSASTEKP